MSIHKKIQEQLGQPLTEIAIGLTYDESNILILENKIDELKKKYPEIYQNLESCSHNKDKRKIEEYGKDLIASWLQEDLLMKKLKDVELEIELNGADKERKILKNSKVTTEADYVIRNGDEIIHLELMNSNTNYLNKAKRVDLRDNKYKKMKQQNAKLLLNDNYNNKFCILDVAALEATYIEKHKPYGDKPVYSISFESTTMNESTIDNIANKIQSLFKTQKTQ